MLDDASDTGSSPDLMRIENHVSTRYLIVDAQAANARARLRTGPIHLFLAFLRSSAGPD